MSIGQRSDRNDLWHPSPEWLHAFAAGGLAVDESMSGTIEAHLEACSSCVGWLDAHRDGLDRAIHSYAWKSTNARDEPPADSLRFRIKREVARGGLGRIFVAEDRELGREVALKQMREEIEVLSTAHRYFRREAVITALLEHPGVIPVYGHGEDSDGRPYIAMRLIPDDGGAQRRLADSIRQFHSTVGPVGPRGTDHSLEFRALLGQFMQVCNTIEYAHSRGIVHRDLKPENILVGRYGETLVIDWGLAKWIGPPTPAGNPASGTEIPGVGHLSELTFASAVGSRVGTPAYMSPEQAEGRTDDINPASDVYGLGATLYEILTGRPPFDHPNKKDDEERVLRNVCTGAFASPRARKRHLPRALDAICLKAMALKASDRYPSGRALGEDVERWLADEPTSAWIEPVPVRLVRWARRHRTLVAVALVTLMMGIGAWGAIERREAVRRSDARRKARTAVVQSEVLEQKARADGNLSLWAQAVESQARARDLLPPGDAWMNDVASRLTALRAEYERARRADEDAVRNRRAEATIEEARLQEAVRLDGQFDSELMATALLQAFSEYGIDVDSLPIPEAVERIRKSEIHGTLVEAIDNWAWYDTARRARLLSIARQCDADPLRDEIRNMLERGGHGDHLAMLKTTHGLDLARYPISTIRNLAVTLLGADRPREALELLRGLYLGHPADLWVCHYLGIAYLQLRPPDAQSALRYFSAALALRPDSPGVSYNIGLAHYREHQYADAVAALRRAVALQDKFAEAHNALGSVYIDQGEPDLALAANRRAVSLRPQSGEFRVNLANTLLDLGKVDEAISELREALRLRPGIAEAHASLGRALAEHGELDEAIAEVRQGIALRPDLAVPFDYLGDILYKKGDWDAAISTIRHALALDPKLAAAHCHLGALYLSRGRWNESIAESRRALALNSRLVAARVNLGSALMHTGRAAAARDTFLEAIATNPNYASAHYNLAIALESLGDHEGAIAAYRRAIASNPAHAEAHCNLGAALRRNGQFDDSLASYEQGHALGTQRPHWPYPSGRWVEEARQLARLDSRISAVLSGEQSPKDPADLMELARFAAHWKRQFDRTAALFERVLARHPEWLNYRRDPPRYFAAACATMAAAESGLAQHLLEDRRRWRERALGWLHLELEALAVTVKTGSQPDRLRALHVLQFWRNDGWLAAIRDPALLTRLSVVERAACSELWAEVDALVMDLSFPSDPLAE
jgi:serine/threonine protein kinase/Tfp pilus assembly protein PilF